MKTRHNALLAFLATLVLLTGAQVASADVQDNAGFFSEDAVRQANFDLKDIKQKYGKDLLVETLPTLPAEVQSQINAQNKDKVYADWAQQRGRDAKLDGVIVLITREPSHLQIGVGSKTQQKAFSLKDRDRMRDQMLTSFRQKQYDQGLLNAVGSYRQTLASNLGGSESSTQVEKPSPGATAMPTSESPQSDPSAIPPSRTGSTHGGGISLWSLIIWGIVIFFLLRLIGGIFRRRATGPMGGGMMGQGNQPSWNQPGYGRGGGFGTGLGGGILGGMLGGWLGSHMFGRGGSSAYGAPPPSTGGQEPGVFSNEDDANFASSGGDFGTGGSDFSGGGDFGGGGGGDFGGGGGDSGGGGDF